MVNGPLLAGNFFNNGQEFCGRGLERRDVDVRVFSLVWFLEDFDEGFADLAEIGRGEFARAVVDEGRGLGGRVEA